MFCWEFICKWQTEITSWDLGPYQAGLWWPSSSWCSCPWGPQPCPSGRVFLFVSVTETDRRVSSTCFAESLFVNDTSPGSVSTCTAPSRFSRPHGSPWRSEPCPSDRLLLLPWSCCEWAKDMTGGGVDEEEADKYLHSIYQSHYFALFLKLSFKLSFNLIVM